MNDPVNYVDLWGLEAADYGDKREDPVYAYTLGRDYTIDLYASEDKKILEQLRAIHMIDNTTSNQNATISEIKIVPDPSPISEYLEENTVVNVTIDLTTGAESVGTLEYLGDGNWRR